MSNNYENILNEFNKKNCQLLTTKEEYDKLINNKNYKLNYIASCGHQNIVFYNVFKYRNTGIICPSCKNKEIGKIKKESIISNQISKICNIEQEFKFIKKFINLVDSHFNVIKAFDGCASDIIFKPKTVIDNKWVGIQVKTTSIKNLSYSFHINNFYKDCLLLLYSFVDNIIWLIPENTIQYQKKISIGLNKSKYNIYEIKENLIERLIELYNSSTKFEFELINLPKNIYQGREQEFRKYRETIIYFLDFKYEQLEGTVYDFKINNFRVQEKVTTINEINNICIFQLCKNFGKKNGKRNQIQYDIGDNDFYWLNLSNKTIFFVIPEKNLYEHGLIGNNISNNTFIKIKIKQLLSGKNKWLQYFMFNYETINDESNKNRLCSLFSN